MIAQQPGEPFWDKHTPAGKKYSVITPSGKLIHFGDSAYEHYRDSTNTGKWTNLDHNNVQRKISYRARFGSRKNKDGKLLRNDMESPTYYSWRYLWS